MIKKPLLFEQNLIFKPEWKHFYESICFHLQGTPRIFLLTKKSVVLADQKTGQVKASVPLLDLASVSVSKQSDGFFALKLKEVTLFLFIYVYFVVVHLKKVLRIEKFHKNICQINL